MLFCYISIGDLSLLSAYIVFMLYCLSLGYISWTDGLTSSYGFISLPSVTRFSYPLDVSELIFSYRLSVFLSSCCRNLTFAYFKCFYSLLYGETLTRFLSLNRSFSIEGVDFKNRKSSGEVIELVALETYREDSAVVLEGVLIVLKREEMLEWVWWKLTKSTPILWPRLSFNCKHWDCSQTICGDSMVVHPTSESISLTCVLTLNTNENMPLIVCVSSSYMVYTLLNATSFHINFSYWPLFISSVMLVFISSTFLWEFLTRR